MEKTRQPAKIPGKQGQVYNTQGDTLNRWVEYFTDLNKQNIPQDQEIEKEARTATINISEGEFSKEEIKTAIANLKNNKAAGIDGICAELKKAIITQHNNVCKAMVDELAQSNPRFIVEPKLQLGSELRKLDLLVIMKDNRPIFRSYNVIWRKNILLAIIR